MDASLLNPVAACAAGLTTSLHCAVMCGPLSCALRVKPLEYHGGRLLSYTLLGALAGAVGQGIVGVLKSDTARLVPWALAAVMLIIGLGLDRRLPQPRLLSRWLLRLRINRSLGLLTPLLPCGPLWLMLSTAALTGSWAGGGLLMASFVAGTIPLPWLLQSQAARLSVRIPPLVFSRGQRLLALVSVALLTWRAVASSHGSCH